MKEFINKISTFCINRLAELVGIAIVALSIFLMISLVSYSPEDPNFIFTDNTEIKNIMGSKGVYIRFIISELWFDFFLYHSLFYLLVLILFYLKILILIENTFFYSIIIFDAYFFHLSILTHTG